MNFHAWARFEMADYFALHGRQATRFAFQLEEHHPRCANQDQVGEPRLGSATVGVVVHEPAGEFCEVYDG